tara:strand:- start:469 stop:999 length:531 start_codon:yes stop_codon:yes gene_type:complete
MTELEKIKKEIEEIKEARAAKEQAKKEAAELAELKAELELLKKSDDEKDGEQDSDNNSGNAVENEVKPVEEKEVVEVVKEVEKPVDEKVAEGSGDSDKPNVDDASDKPADVAPEKDDANSGDVDDSERLELEKKLAEEQGVSDGKKEEEEDKTITFNSNNIDVKLNMIKEAFPHSI